ncbi:MAG: GAF domain-containing protein, partial [Anaerolineae bacterium]|nr:GAF domain-containing protein [Anaerolineae bacterium]
LTSPLQSQERRAAYSQVAVQLSRFLSRKGAFVEFSLLEAQTGQTLVSTALEREGESHAEQAYFLQGLKGAYLQPPAFDPAVNAPTILVSRPVFGPDGEVIAVLLGRANLFDLNSLLQAGAELGETYLVSANGLYVAGSLKPEDTPTGVIYSFAIREALNGGAGVEQYVDFQGQEVMGAYRYLPELNVALLIEVDQDTATAGARRQAYMMLGVLAVATALGIVAALLLTRRVVNPIIELTEAATEIAEGDLLRMAPVQRTDEIGTLAQAFNSMTAQLRDLIGSLEQRVAERTHDLARRSAELEASAQVAREAAAIRDVKQLLDATVRLISEQFGFYHAGIFLLDEAKTYAILAAASSEGGQRMLARGHRLEVGQVGIVGYVSAQGEPRVALDVGQDAYFFNNPDLPETRSEAGLPLMVHAQVIGVLDVQSERAAAFSAADVEILQTLADQLALAIDNAHLLEESRQTLQELQTLYGQQTRSAWQERLGGKPVGYLLSGGQVAPLEQEPPLPAGTLQASTKQAELQAEGRRIVAPVSLRGQNVGSLVFWREEAQEPWLSEDVATLESLSVQVGLALENARLLEDTQRRAQRESNIREIDDKIGASFDLETVLRTAVEELSVALGAGGALVELGLPQQEEK